MRVAWPTQAINVMPSARVSASRRLAVTKPSVMSSDVDGASGWAMANKSSNVTVKDTAIIDAVRRLEETHPVETEGVFAARHANTESNAARTASPCAPNATTAYGRVILTISALAISFGDGFRFWSGWGARCARSGVTGRRWISSRDVHCYALPTSAKRVPSGRLLTPANT